MQYPELSQQPLLHWDAVPPSTLHLPVHTPATHALLPEQSVSFRQPHLDPTHAWPRPLFVQLTQAASEPQLVWVPPG
jgi:hypothetical protein